MYAIAVTAAVLIVRRRWRAGRRRPRPGLRRRDLGFPGRADRRPPLLRHHQLRTKCPTPGGGRSRSGTAASGSGAGSPSAPLVGDLARPPGRRLGPRLHGRDRPRPARRPGDRPGRQLLQPGALRRPDQPPLGPPDLTRTPPRRLPPLRHLPADLPLRDHLEPRPWPPSSSGSATTARSARPASSPSTSPATRPSASSRRACGSTPPTTSSASASTSGWRSSSRRRRDLVRLDPAPRDPEPSEPIVRSPTIAPKASRLRRISVTTSTLYNFRVMPLACVEDEAN